MCVHLILVEDTTRSTVLLSWTSPSFDGGCDVLGYVVEMMQKDASLSPTESLSVEDEDEDDFQCDELWTKVSGSQLSIDNEFCVTGLNEGLSYVFRVAAVNKLGSGAYATIR